MNKWDIWVADFRYEDQPEQSKRRPVLLLDVSADGSDVLLAKITTVTDERRMRKNKVWGEYELLDYEKAKLDKPSIVRLSKTIVIPPDKLEYKIGRLQARDVLNIQKLLKQYKGKKRPDEQ